MADQVRERSSRSGAVDVEVLDDPACWRVRSWAFGPPPLPLPQLVGSTLPGVPRVLCTGPGDWLIVGAADSARLFVEALRQENLALTDMTQGFALLEIRGPSARELLSKACGLDLHSRTLPPGRCARTRFADIPAVLDCRDDSPRFHLYVARSYLAYLRSWLADAAAEF